MTLTANKLTLAAGVSAALSGLLYITVQFIHPVETIASVTTTEWAVVAWMTVAVGVFGLIGVTGMYLRQVREIGVLGLIGFLLLGVFFLTTAAFSFVEALVLPAIVGKSPQVVEDILGIFSGVPTDGSLGALEGLSTFAFAVYLLGGLVFGIALFRARVLSRWAGILLAVGAVSTLLVPLLPHQVARFAAVAVGLALIWLGYALWADGRKPANAPASRIAAQLGSPAAE